NDMKLPSKKILIYLPVLFFAGIILISCKTNFIGLRIENSTPSRDELPEDIQSLTLMNRSMNNQFLNHIEDSLQMYFYRNEYQLSKIVLDSTAADTTLKALSALLFESGRYDVVVPVERNLPRNLTYNLLPDTLNQDQVSQICRDYNTDALLVLERFSTKVMTDYSAEKYVDATVGTSYSYYASLDLKYDAFFRIYKPGELTPVKQFAITDTINWENSDNMQARLFSRIPTIKQAMISAAIKVALDLDGKLSPSWTTENRGYFIFSRKNDRGQQLMTENNYEEAEKYWAGLAKSKNRNIRSKAEFNMALISELNGDIDAAINWGLKSFYSTYHSQTEAYLKKLQFRKETQSKPK
ncbi:MAG: DUF6340 family protein, partial [Prolixibacteraceae bacterium]